MNNIEKAQKAITALLREQLALPGAWVLAVESCDPETGETLLTSISSNEGTYWSRVGMARVMTINLESTAHNIADRQNKSNE